MPTCATIVYRAAVTALLAAAIACVARGQDVDPSNGDAGDRQPTEPAQTPPPGDARLNSRNLGLNYPWVDDHQGHVQFLWMRDYQSQLVEDDLETIASLGVRIIRVFAPVEAVMSYSEVGFTIVEERAAGVDALLHSAARRNMQVILVMGDGNVLQRPEDLDGKFRWELVQSEFGLQVISSACAAYVRRFRAHDNILMWELANEAYSNLTWATYPQELQVSLDETHTYLRSAYEAVKPLTKVAVGFSDVHEEEQDKYRFFTNPEFRQRYIDDATDVYSIHVYRESPRQVPDFSGLTGKPKWCTELGSYSYEDETGKQHSGLVAHGELWDEHKNLRAVTALVPRLLDGGFDLLLPWAFTFNDGMVVHRPDRSHELKSLPRWMQSQLQGR